MAFGFMVWLAAGFAAAALSTPATTTSTTTSACTLDPNIPTHISEHAYCQPLCAGYLDPTQLPYSAKGDGVTDDSAALQTALDDAYVNRMAVLLPAGRVYILGRQLRAVQVGNRYAADREHGYQLIGARGAVPPVLRVMDGADLASFPATYVSRSNANLVAHPVLLYVRGELMHMLHAFAGFFYSTGGGGCCTNAQTHTAIRKMYIYIGLRSMYSYCTVQPVMAIRCASAPLRTGTACIVGDDV